MDNLITVPTYTLGSRINPTLNKYAEKERANLVKITQYYRNEKRAVNSTHALVKLIYSLALPLSDDYMEIYQWAQEITDEVCAGVGITTGVNEQMPFESMFYDNCQDYLVADNHLRIADVIDLVGSPLESNWSPVTVHYQPYILPIHHRPAGGVGKKHYSVIGVDVPAIALMYSAWAKYNQTLPETARESVEQFVGIHLLPRMLASQYHSSRLNSLLNNIVGDGVIVETTPPTMLVDVMDSTIKAESKQVTALTGSSKAMFYPLLQFPSLKIDKTLGEIFREIDNVDTKPLYTARVLKTLPVLLLVTGMGQQAGDKSKVAKAFNLTKRVMRSRRTIDNLPQQLRYDVEDKLNLIDFLLNN